ncbi:MAG: carbon-nitrogen hydrolase [Verrucomicrobia bacterium]|nr:MAG: carbon-nitrogen hydrolase [Verrucomicrobiota bacterium]
MVHTSKVLRVGLVQMRCSADPLLNLEKAQLFIKEAAARGAQVVCLPELFLSEYFCQKEDHSYFELAEPIPGPTTMALGALAKEYGIVVIGSLFERRAPGLYHNSAAILDADGTYLGKYRKMHIPDDPLFYEKFYFTPGDLGFRSWSTQAGRIGVLICWDQWYPEAARLTALRGAEVLFYPTAIGWHPSEKKEFGKKQKEAWQLAQRAHALANGVYVAGINRIGHEAPAGGEGLEFWGSSLIAAPDGSLVVEASENEEEVLIADLDLSLLNTQRTHWPFLRDRRIDAYEGMNQRYLDGE